MVQKQCAALYLIFENNFDGPLDAYLADLSVRPRTAFTKSIPAVWISGCKWALGIMCGVNMRPDDWRELMDFDNSPGYLFPMMWLCHERDPDPELRPAAFSEKA